MSNEVWEGWPHVGAVLKALGSTDGTIEGIPQSTNEELAESMGPELWAAYQKLRRKS